MPNIDDALRYNELALCVIPICAGKKTPVGLWKKYQRGRPTTDKLDKYHQAYLQEGYNSAYDNPDPSGSTTFFIPNQ